MNCPHTWFSTEFHSKPRLIKVRLQDLLTTPRRRGTLPALLTLLCVVSLGLSLIHIWSGRAPGLLRARLRRAAGR